MAPKNKSGASKTTKVSTSTKNTNYEESPLSSPTVTPIGSEKGFDFASVLDQIDVCLSAKGEPGLELMNKSFLLILSTLQGVAKALDLQARSYDNLIKENKSQTGIIEKLVSEISECKKVNKIVTEENAYLSGKLNDLSSTPGITIWRFRVYL